MNSDDGYLLYFGKPNEKLLIKALNRINNHFPAGLKTEAGIMVANPCYDSYFYNDFDKNKYHGTGILIFKN